MKSVENVGANVGVSVVLNGHPLRLNKVLRRMFGGLG